MSKYGKPNTEEPGIRQPLDNDHPSETESNTGRSSLWDVWLRFWPQQETQNNLVLLPFFTVILLGQKLRNLRNRCDVMARQWMKRIGNEPFGKIHVAITPQTSSRQIGPALSSFLEELRRFLGNLADGTGDASGYSANLAYGNFCWGCLATVSGGDRLLRYHLPHHQNLALRTL